MSGIVINHDQCLLCGACITACPFNALTLVNEKVEVNAACKLCKACLKVCPVFAISIEAAKKVVVDKSLYKGILVYVEHSENKIHPVTYELIGKALELAAVIKQDVYCLMIGDQIVFSAQELLAYGVKQVLVYDDPALRYFRADIFANVFEQAINMLKPNTVLVGATTIGRSLAPRVATRFKTGLTADTTVLQMRENTDLVQIRPAFGGNIMAQILTTNTRPQFATVRYKVMNTAEKVNDPQGEVISCPIDPSLLQSKITIEHVEKKHDEEDISSADIIIVAGCGVKDDKGFKLVTELANELKAAIGVTRPMVEKGVASYLHQIGLSGRTVKPKLIITCGVSGAIQFVAGMNNSDTIIAINSDPNAPIFKTANYAVVGDLYEILPELITKLKKGVNYEL